MQDGRKAVWSIPYVSVVFFPSLKQNFIAYRSSKVNVIARLELELTTIPQTSRIPITSRGFPLQWGVIYLRALLLGIVVPMQNFVIMV